MSASVVKPPSVPITFQGRLKVVAIVDPANPQVREILDQIRADNYEVEVTDSFERDVSEDSDVGA
jgi:ornithine decarboxylase